MVCGVQFSSGLHDLATSLLAHSSIEVSAAAHQFLLSVSTHSIESVTAFFSPATLTKLSHLSRFDFKTGATLAPPTPTPTPTPSFALNTKPKPSADSSTAGSGVAADTKQSSDTKSAAKRTANVKNKSAGPAVVVEGDPTLAEAEAVTARIASAVGASDDSTKAGDSKRKYEKGMDRSTNH